MKKITAFFMALTMCAYLAACGGTNEESAVPQTETETQQSTDVQTETETQQGAVEESTAEESQSQPTKETQSAEETQPEASEGTTQAASEEESAQGGYEDNFAVDSAAAAEFAEQIKEAVAAQDLEALADLAAYPLYVGIAEDGVSSREDLIALGAEAVFTSGLSASIEAADTQNLTPSMAGFVLSDGSGNNIIFSVVDGELAIQGINYE